MELRTMGNWDKFGVWVTIIEALQNHTTSSSQDEHARKSALELAFEEKERAYQALWTKETA
jgi:hypothetical protein